MHSYIDPTINQSFKITTRTCECFYKVYNFSSILNLPGSIFSRFIFLFKDLDKLSEPLILYCNPTFILNTLFAALFIANFRKKDLQYIIKMVLKAQALAPAPIIILEDL